MKHLTRGAVLGVLMSLLVISLCAAGAEKSALPGEFREILTSHIWSFQRPKGEKHFIRFDPDGIVRTSIKKGKAWAHWEVIGLRKVRLSRGKMLGVDFNKGMDWVGSSVALWPKAE